MRAVTDRASVRSDLRRPRSRGSAQVAVVANDPGQHERRRSLVLLAGAALGVAAVLALTTVARADDKAASVLPPVPLATLDALLGVPTAGGAASSNDRVVSDVIRQRLDRLLEQDAPEDDEFKQAVALMNQSATRLEASGALTGDTSASTQRLQEEAIRKLDQLIAKAKKNKSQCDKPCQEGESKSEQEQQSQPQQAQASQHEQGQSGREQKGAELPAVRKAELRPALESARAAWGNLPDRVRSSLVQGAGDRFSREYQRLTEEYYKRLGEHAE